MTRKQRFIRGAIALLALETLIVLAPSIPFPFLSDISVLDLAGGSFSGGRWSIDRLIIVGCISGSVLGFALAVAENRRAASVGIALQAVGLVTLVAWILQMFLVVKTTAA